MNLEHKNKGQFSSSDSSELLQDSQSSKLFNFFGHTHISPTLLFTSSILEIILSFSVILASIVGLIQPLWFATFVCMLASITSIIGGFILYSMTHKNSRTNELIHNAMQRIMNAKN